jgi:hypothetical protein
LKTYIDIAEHRDMKLESDLEKTIRDLQKRVASLEQAIYKSSTTSTRGLEKRLVEKVDEMGTQELIMIALRLKEKQSKEEIKAVLSDWGKAYGSWFEGGNFSGRLIKKGFVKKDGQSSSGEDLFSLTKKGEVDTDNLISNLQS